VTFKAPPDGSPAATAIRTRACIPPDCPVHMFEVEVILMSGVPAASKIGASSRSQRCFEWLAISRRTLAGILVNSRYRTKFCGQVHAKHVAIEGGDACSVHAAVGLQYSDSLLTKLPGQERCSLAVHSDDGQLHSVLTGAPQPFMHFGAGDVVGVLVDRVADSVSFSKNGMHMGVAMSGLPSRPMYPCLGFDGGNAKVDVNFGSRPFRCSFCAACLALVLNALS
jgi:SPRY domain